MEQLGFHWTDFHEIMYMSIFQKFVEKIQVWLKSVKNSGTVHEDVSTFMIISHRFLLRMKNVSDKFCREYQNMYFMFSIFSPQNRAF